MYTGENLTFYKNRIQSLTFNPPSFLIKSTSYTTLLKLNFCIKFIPNIILFLKQTTFSSVASLTILTLLHLTFSGTSDPE